VPSVRQARLLILYLTLVALAAALASEVWGLRNNTLERNGHWHSAKLDLERALIGAVSFVVTPVALHRNRLDLSSWYGFQQLTWFEPLDAERLEFSFELAPRAHLSIFYGGVVGGWGGTRLSHDLGLGSRHFLARASGEVVAADLLDFSVGGGKHRVVVDLGVRTRVSVDGEELPPAPGIPAGPRRLGFRGSASSAWIDDVRLTLRDGRVLHEDFRASGTLVRALAIGLGLLLATELAVRTARGRARPEAPFALWWPRLAVAGVASGVAALAWGAQVTYLGILYPEEIRSEVYTNRIETPGQALARLGTLDDPRPGILVIGTSQTWGAGAASADDTWTARLEADLGGRYRVWNAGISGSKAATLARFYRQRWAQAKPRLVIAVFGVNDVDPDVFEQSLAEIIAIGRDFDIPTLLVQEPFAPDAPPRRWLPENREHMRRAAEHHGLALFDMHSALSDRRNEAWMWWDYVHLTSQGQALFAQELLPSVIEALGEEPPAAQPARQAR